MIKKVSAVFISIFICILFSSFITAPAYLYQKQLLKTIVIDAGHGGTDFGAGGAYSYEKNITLSISLKLQKALQEAMPDVKIVMTRTTDIYQHPTLKANIANQAKGDLFVCIHVNSAPAQKHSEITGYKTVTYYTGKGKKRKKHTKQVPQYRYWTTPNPAKGTETFIWGVDKNDDKQVALRENASLYLDSNLAKQIGDFDPNSPDNKILYSLKMQQYFTRSVNLAQTVEDEFANIGRNDREVRQRQVGIWVLQATAMPSVLIETGFISNPEEEDYLNSQIGQDELTGSIVKAIQRYRSALENNALIAVQQQADSSN